MPSHTRRGEWVGDTTAAVHTLAGRPCKMRLKPHLLSRALPVSAANPGTGLAAAAGALRASFCGAWFAVQLTLQLVDLGSNVLDDGRPFVPRDESLHRVLQNLRCVGAPRDRRRRRSLVSTSASTLGGDKAWVAQPSCTRARERRRLPTLQKKDEDPFSVDSTQAA